MRVFGASGEGAELIRFFCIYIAPSWIVVGWLFVANAALQQSRLPDLVDGVQLGPRDGRHRAVRVDRRDPIRRRWRARRSGAGAVAFGVGAVVVCFMVVGKLAARRRAAASPDESPATAPPIPPFSSGKAATAIDWADPDEDVKRP